MNAQTITALTARYNTELAARQDAYAATRSAADFARLTRWKKDGRAAGLNWQDKVATPDEAAARALLATI